MDNCTWAACGDAALSEEEAARTPGSLFLYATGTHRSGVVITETGRRKPLGLSPRDSAGLRWLEPEVLPLAYWPIVSYNYDMNTPPDYQTIRIWTRTLRSLRLLAALTGERMVQVFDRLITEELRRIQEQAQREKR